VEIGDFVKLLDKVNRSLDREIVFRKILRTCLNDYPELAAISAQEMSWALFFMPGANAN
jgi:hypothetical protein